MSWFLSIPICSAAIAKAQDTHSAETGLRALSRQRKDFEKLVVDDPRYEMEEHIYSMPLDQHLEGYYPIGVSDHRYLLDVNCGAHSLLCQSIRDGRARTRWRLVLKDSHGPARFHGTLGQMLHNFGSEVSGKVTASERASLNAKAQFAGYDMGGVDGALFSAWVVKPNGTPMTYHFYDNGTTYQGRKWVPITDDEAQALGLGNVSWPPGVKPRLRNGPP